MRRYPENCVGMHLRLAFASRPGAPGGFICGLRRGDLTLLACLERFSRRKRDCLRGDGGGVVFSGYRFWRADWRRSGCTSIRIFGTWFRGDCSPPAGAGSFVWQEDAADCCFGGGRHCFAASPPEKLYRDCKRYGTSRALFYISEKQKRSNIIKINCKKIPFSSRIFLFWIHTLLRGDMYGKTA